MRSIARRTEASFSLGLNTTAGLGMQVGLGIPAGLVLRAEEEDLWVGRGSRVAVVVHCHQYKTPWRLHKYLLVGRNEGYTEKLFRERSGKGVD